MLHTHQRIRIENAFNFSEVQHVPWPKAALMLRYGSLDIWLCAWPISILPIHFLRRWTVLTSSSSSSQSPFWYLIHISFIIFMLLDCVNWCYQHELDYRYNFYALIVFANKPIFEMLVKYQQLQHQQHQQQQLIMSVERYTQALPKHTNQKPDPCETIIIIIINNDDWKYTNNFCLLFFFIILPMVVVLFTLSLSHSHAV